MDNKKAQCCEEYLVHKEVVDSKKNTIPDEETLCEVAELFKVFGDSTRTLILAALFESEMCVCDIASLLNMSMSAISHQLRILRQTKIVKSRRSGKEVFYSLADKHIEMIYKMAYEHITEGIGGNI